MLGGKGATLAATLAGAGALFALPYVMLRYSAAGAVTTTTEAPLSNQAVRRGAYINSGSRDAGVECVPCPSRFCFAGLVPSSCLCRVCYTWCRRPKWSACLVGFLCLEGAPWPFCALLVCLGVGSVGTDTSAAFVCMHALVGFYTSCGPALSLSAAPGAAQTGWTAVTSHSDGGDAKRERQHRLPHRSRGVAPPPRRAAPGRRRPPANPWGRVGCASRLASASLLRVRGSGRRRGWGWLSFGPVLGAVPLPLCRRRAATVRVWCGVCCCACGKDDCALARLFRVCLHARWRLDRGKPRHALGPWSLQRGPTTRGAAVSP